MPAHEFADLAPSGQEGGRHREGGGRFHRRGPALAEFGQPWASIIGKRLFRVEALRYHTPAGAEVAVQSSAPFGVSPAPRGAAPINGLCTAPPY
ncbi:hypothetical protein [Azospirillum largimobile]